MTMDAEPDSCRCRLSGNKAAYLRALALQMIPMQAGIFFPPFFQAALQEELSRVRFRIEAIESVLLSETGKRLVIALHQAKVEW
jgi:hypothetical protein